MMTVKERAIAFDNEHGMMLKRRQRDNRLDDTFGLGQGIMLRLPNDKVLSILIFGSYDRLRLSQALYVRARWCGNVSKQDWRQAWSRVPTELEVQKRSACLRYSKLSNFCRNWNTKAFIYRALN